MGDSCFPIIHGALGLDLLSLWQSGVRLRVFDDLYDCRLLDRVGRGFSWLVRKVLL